MRASNERYSRNPVQKELPNVPAPPALFLPCSRWRSSPRRRLLRRKAFSDGQRGEIETIIKNYLVSHPEVLEEAMAELNKRQAAAEDEKHEASIAQNSNAIFNSPRNVTLGNKSGDVTFVEFFDYNCGYCKRAMSDMLDLMKSDPKLKVVLKEFPVLSEGSVEAAKVAVAVRMQDPGGEQISRLPSEAARRPRPRRQGTRARCRQGRGARRRPYREGHGKPRGPRHDRGELQAR